MKSNRFWKKGLALLLSATFTLGTLAGCGTYEGDGSSASNVQGSGNTQQAAAGVNGEGKGGGDT